MSKVRVTSFGLSNLLQKSENPERVTVPAEDLSRIHDKVVSEGKERRLERAADFAAVADKVVGAEGISPTM